MSWFISSIIFLVLPNFTFAYSSQDEVYQIQKVSKNKKSVIVKYKSNSKIKKGMLFEVQGSEEEECHLRVRKVKRSKLLMDSRSCLDKNLLTRGRKITKSSIYKNVSKSHRPQYHLVGQQKAMEIGVYYSLGTKIAEAGKGTLGSTSYTVDVDIATTGALGFELGYGVYAPNGSGYRMNGFFETMRAINSSESKIDGIPNASVTYDPKPSVTIYGLTADYVYTLPSFIYTTVGINLTKTEIKDDSNSLVRNLGFNLGFQFGAGYRMATHSSFEMNYRYYKSSGDVDLGVSSQTYKVDALTTTALTLSYKYHF